MRFRFLFAAFFWWSLSGASFGATAFPKDVRSVSVAVGGKDSFYYLPFTLADRLGFFESEGIYVNVVDVAGGVQSLNLLNKKTVDFAAASFEHVVLMQAQGVPVVAIAAQADLPGLVLGINRHSRVSYKDARSLKGLRIGVTSPGSSTHMFVSLLMHRAGISPDAATFVGVGNGERAINALRNKEIDALAHADPVITEAAVGGNLRLVVDTRTRHGVREVYGDSYVAGCLITRTDFAANNPDVAQRMVNAMVRALKWLQQASPDQIGDVIASTSSADDRFNFKMSVMKNIGAYSKTGLIKSQGAENVLNAMRTFNPKVRNADIALSSAYDNRFVLRALAASDE